MYPSKSMLDYMTEMNRYPKTGGENDIFQSPLATSSFSHYNAQSSSSTETSPDSFPDLTPHQFQPEFRPEEAWRPSLYRRNPQCRQELYDNKHENYKSRANVFEANARLEHSFEGHIRPVENYMNTELTHRNQRPDMTNLFPADSDTPLIRRQRPIMGRKIMADTLKTIDEFPIWQPMPHTPPKSHRNTQNIYELFPSEHRGFEFPSPAKSPHTPQLRTSPRVSLSPKTPSTPPPRSPFFSITFKEPLVSPSTSFTSYGSSKMCTFCRKNGETPQVYMDHTVKEKVGNRNVVTCPILRSHICSACGASGDNAHTITYCPVLRSGNNGQPLQSTTITLKNTRVKSNGRRRY